MQTLPLFDAHNHLQDERFDGMRDGLIATARQAGVVRMVVNGSTEADWPAVAQLATAHPDLVIPSFGLHPWYVHERTPHWRDALIAYLEQFPQAGVGEIGLDRWKADLPWAGQAAVFLEQYQIAVEYSRPVSIHCLQAWGGMVDLLESHPAPANGFLLHSYGGSKELVGRLAARGAYFSFPGAFARERKVRQREAFQHVPLDRLLIETDAPDQLPPPACSEFPLADQEGKPLQHPANLRALYPFVAEMLSMPVQALADQVERNFLRFTATTL